MPETEKPKAVVTFSHKEVAEALIRHHGITKGIWMLHIEFVMGAGNIPGPDGKVLPSALLGINKVGLTQTDIMSELSVDASTLSPKEKKKKKQTASEYLADPNT